MFNPNPKPKKIVKRNTHKPNTAESKHLRSVKELDCIACGKHAPSDAHHITDCGRRISHYHTLPLCKGCHQTGNISVHGSKRTFEAKWGTQLQLLEKTKRLLNEGS